MERRYCNSVEVRALGEGRIGGTASVVYDGSAGSEYELFPGAMERIKPGAFDSILRTSPDIVALFNHDMNVPLARTPDTLRVWSDNSGLHYELTLPTTSAGSDLYKLIESRIVRGSSFGAVVGYAQWSKEGGRDIRTIHRFSRLVDVSPVTFPAYSGASVGLRSADIAGLVTERDQSLATQARIELAKNL